MIINMLIYLFIAYISLVNKVSIGFWESKKLDYKYETLYVLENKNINFYFLICRYIQKYLYYQHSKITIKEILNNLILYNSINQNQLKLI